MSIATPDEGVRDAAQERLARLATPPGALGHLGDCAVWLASVQGYVPPKPVVNPRLVVFAGDHGVSAHGVSAFPATITRSIVRSLLTGQAGVSAMAAVHGVAVRVLDLCVDGDFEDVDGETRAALMAYKVCRGSGAIDVEDALTPHQLDLALAAGAAIADEEIAAGADLLISGDVGIGNTTPATAMIAAGLGLSAQTLTGRGTGIDDGMLAHKVSVIEAALQRVPQVATDPMLTLRALSSADLAAVVGFQLQAARRGVPVLLDGLMSVACALTAERLEPGARAWFWAGHRSTEPAQSFALERLGLRPLLELRLRLGEGSGAVAAVPLLQTASALLRDVGLLDDLDQAP